MSPAVMADSETLRVAFPGKPGHGPTAEHEERRVAGVSGTHDRGPRGGVANPCRRQQHLAVAWRETGQRGT